MIEMSIQTDEEEVSAVFSNFMSTQVEDRQENTVQTVQPNYGRTVK